MAEFNENITNILKSAENNKEYDENMKNIISQMVLAFYEELDKIREEYNTKLEHIIFNQKEMENKVAKLQNSVKDIEEDIYEDTNGEFEIICPYCNYEFVADLLDDENEIQCPECKNLIEISFGDEGCSGKCGHNHCSDSNGICGCSNEDE